MIIVNGECLTSSLSNGINPDGDGVGDGIEVSQGSDPADPDDNGNPANCVAVSLVIGDHSGSHSERYEMLIGDKRHQAPQFGELSSNNYAFVKGKSYPFRVNWIDTNGEGEGYPDYDYTAKIAGMGGGAGWHASTNILLHDPQGVLGEHDESTYNFAAGKTGTLYVPMVEIDPSLDIVADGDGSDAFTASVTPSGLSGLTYEWTWSAPAGAGNNPTVTFSAPNAAQTTIQQVHWFALPDAVCDADIMSTYTLTCTVKYNGQPICSDTTALSVTLLDPGGYTTPPLLQGFPSIAYNSTQSVYYVNGEGTLNRIPADPDVYLPTTSQFTQKIEAHENQHKQDFDNGFDGHQFVTVDELFFRIQNFSASTQTGLVAAIQAEADAYIQDEINEINSVRGCLETRAHQVSDPIAPQYFYHNCGQFTCP